MREGLKTRSKKGRWRSQSKRGWRLVVWVAVNRVLTGLRCVGLDFVGGVERTSLSVGGGGRGTWEKKKRRCDASRWNSEGGG